MGMAQRALAENAALNRRQRDDDNDYRSESLYTKRVIKKEMK
jgi:hypothetical protein